jgi:hypothetical protein
VVCGCADIGANGDWCDVAVLEAARSAALTLERLAQTPRHPDRSFWLRCVVLSETPAESKDFCSDTADSWKISSYRIRPGSDTHRRRGMDAEGEQREE